MVVVPKCTFDVVNDRRQTCTMGRVARRMRSGMRNAWPRGPAAVCTCERDESLPIVCNCNYFWPLQPFSITVFSPLATRTNPDRNVLQNGSLPRFPISHTSTPTLPASADHVPIRHAPRAVQTRATSMAASDTTAAPHGCAHRAGRLCLGWHGPFIVGILCTLAW